MRVLLAALLLASVVSNAATVDVSWDHPVTRVNGAPLDVRELREYTVQWTCLSGKSSVNVPVEETRVTQVIDMSGPCGFQVRATDINGLVSEWSDPATVILPAEVQPNAPASITIEIKFN